MTTAFLGIVGFTLLLLTPFGIVGAAIDPPVHAPAIPPDPYMSMNGPTANTCIVKIAVHSSDSGVHLTWQL